MSRRIFYNGDADIERGGYFYTIADVHNGYANAVRVTPCSEAGGPDNVFWVEQLAVTIPDGWAYALRGRGDTIEIRRAHRTLHNLPDATKAETALACIGYDTPDMLADYDKRTAHERTHIMIYACLSYGYFDSEATDMVSLGKPEFTTNREGKWTPSKVLRANASLRNYARGKL